MVLRYYIEFFRCFAKGYRKYIPVIIAGAVVSGVLEIAGILLLVPLIQLITTPEAIDRYPIVEAFFRLIRIESPLHQAGFIGAAILLIFVLKNVYLTGFYYWQNTILRRWKVDIGNSLMRYYLFAPYKLHFLKTSSQIIRNLKDVIVMALNTFVFQGFLLVSNVIAGGIILSILIHQYVFFTIVTGVVLIVTSATLYTFIKFKLRRLGEERNQLEMQQYGNVAQSLKAIKETKVMGCEQHFLDSFSAINQSMMKNDMWAMFYHHFAPQATEVSTILCVVIMCIGVVHSNFGDNAAMVASLGVLAAIAFRTSSIVNRILNSLQMISHSQNSVKILLEEFQDPMWSESVELEATSRSGGLEESLTFTEQIRFREVSYSYPDAEMPALDRINVCINKGEFIGIIGPSGAGKSTFVDILLGLLEPDSGRVMIDQTVLKPATLRCWQRHLGYVPQQVYVMDDTIIQNVAFGMRDEQADIERIKNVLKKANLYDHIQSLPNGLNSRLGEDGRRLSAGQKQRIGIARALYHHADVLIMDEATSSLDVSTEGEITRAINALKGQQTIIAIAHRLTTLKSCDRILYFDEGKLLDTGTFETLSQQYPKFDEMVKLSQI